MRARVLSVAVLLLAIASTAEVPPVAGRNSVPVRGKAQTVHYYPATAAAPAACTVEFLPGDGGWWGLAIEMAEKMASWGCDVYGLDTKLYLESFTGHTTLTDIELMGDVRETTGWIGKMRR